MRYISLFSGIGGLDRAIDSLGGECVVQVEREPYCLDILRLRWPEVPKIENVYGFRGHMVDLVVGGPPCQPVSHAGRRKGQADERWLWGEALRVVGEALPERVFFENPMGLRTLGLDQVLAGLTELGYGGAWEVVAAADVGAPHLRKRIFIMGIRSRSGWDGPTRPPGNRAVAWPTPTASERSGSRIGTNAHPGVNLSQAVKAAPTLWPSPNASGERPNEGNVRLLRARVLAGDLTEAEAAGMLNGKSVFEAQGKVPAMEVDRVQRASNAVVGVPPLVPSPSSADGTGGPGTSPKREGGLNLRTYAAKFPTPLSVPTSEASHNQVSGRFRDALEKAWERWPTPTSRDYKDTGDSIMDGTVPVNGLLGRAVAPSRERGALNPSWVEWLMGLPIGWTDIGVAEPGPLYGWESEPVIPRIGLGIPNRSKRLTALGNAVVPAQAMFAWQRLCERLGVE